MADLVDPSVAGAEPDASDLAHDRDAITVGSENANPEALANGSAENASVTTARLQTIITLADEIGSLSRKRLAAVARGRDLGKGDRARLHQLTSGLADEVAAFRLQPDRVSDLIEELERGQRTLCRIERRPLEVGVERVCGFRTSATSSPGSAEARRRSRPRASDDEDAPPSGGFDHAKVPTQEFAGPPRPDPRRQFGPHACDRKVRLSSRGQDFDLCCLVDPPVDCARYCRPIAYDPHSRAYDRERREGVA